ncbi:MAG: hypothetical protein ACR2NJ_00900 [Acidimicrobiales bacterium]
MGRASVAVSLVAVAARLLSRPARPGTSRSIGGVPGLAEAVPDAVGVRVVAPVTAVGPIDVPKCDPVAVRTSVAAAAVGTR